MSNPPTSSRAGVRGLAIFTAAVAASIALLLADQLMKEGIAVDTGSGVQPVGVVGAIVATVVTGLAGWGLLTLLERFTKSPRIIWTVTAVVFLLFSLLGPLGAITAGAKMALISLHLLVGAIIIPVFARTAAPR
jgi:hypothetical protein